MRRGRLLLEWMLIGLGASALVLLVSQTEIVTPADRLIYDVAAPLRAAPASDRIVIIAIDDTTLASVGRWPWPRDTHAKALTTIGGMRPAAILYDVLFLEPTPADRELTSALSSNAPVYLPVLFEIPGSNGAPQQLYFPVPAIAQAAAGVGSANLSLDDDGRARRVELSANNEDQRLPHMTELAYRRLTGHPSPAFRRLENGTTEPTVNIAFLPPDSFRTISMLSILRGEVPVQFLQDKIILVGATAEGLGDIHPVSTLSSGRLPGVEVQANLLSSLLADRFIHPVSGGWISLLSLLPLWLLLAAFWRLSPSRSLLLSLGALAAILGGSIALPALTGLWVPPVAALLGIALVYPLWGWRRLAALTQFMSAEVNALLAHTGISDPQPKPAWSHDRVASDAGRLHQIISIMQRTAREREEMLQFLSHDMRSPQAAILTLLNGAKGDEAEPGLKERIRGHAERTLHLADDFVQLARLEGRKTRHDPVDPRDAMAQAADALWEMAKARSVTIRAASATDPEEEELWVMGDAEALVRAFRNLMHNAIDISAQGGIVEYGASKTGEQVTAFVRDHGPGLPPERQAAPFARFGFSRDGGKGGSGLGLAYVATVAERHRGSAEYEEPADGGAQFTLRLPLASAEELAEHDAQSHHEQSG